MKSINGFIRKEWKRRQYTNLPHFWSNLQSAGYWPQRHFLTRSRMATWRLRYIKVRREKALETWVCNLKSDWTSPALQSDPKENVAGSLGFLEILSQSTSFSSLRASLSAPSCVIWQSVLIPLFLSQWFQTQLAFLQANAGWEAGGEATEEEKPLLYVLCMERKS